MYKENDMAVLKKGSFAVEALAKLAERMKIAWQRKRKGGSGRPFLA
jgi:hypothetical protein